MRVRLRSHRQPLVRPFPVSYMTTEAVDILTLHLVDDDGEELGAGEISADAGHDQDGAAIAASATALAESLVTSLSTTPGTTPGGRSGGTVDVARLAAGLAAAEAHASGPARTLVEMAFLDAAARQAGQPVWRLVGLPEPAPISLMRTVPIGEPLPDNGLVKIKLGGPDDAAVLRRLRSVAGPVILDVNRGWDATRWRELAPLVRALAPAALEDPVADQALLPEVRAALPGTAVILDEGVDTAADVRRAALVADGANIKVMKLGGLLAARDALAHLAERGARRMLGCYLEPPRSIAYAAQLGGLCDWTDLDGHFWLTDDPATDGFALDSRMPGIPRMVTWQGATR